MPQPDERIESFEIQLAPEDVAFYTAARDANRRLEFCIDEVSFTDSNDIEYQANCSSLMPQGGPNMALVTYSDIGPMDAIHQLKKGIAAIGYDPQLRITGYYHKTESV